MDKKLENSLVSYGLTENEAKIYTYLLRSVESSVFSIAKETEIPRATIYITLEKMKKTNLVSSVKKNNVLHYSAENPHRLKTLVDEKQKLLTEIMPALNAIINTEQDKPYVKIYTGEDGIKFVFEDILETMQREHILILLAASRSEIVQKFPKYFPEWMRRREVLNIHTKLILPESERTEGAFTRNPLRETRYLPNGFTSTIEIYGSKMALFNLKDNEIYSIVIESMPVVQTFTQFFNAVWEKANK